MKVTVDKVADAVLVNWGERKPGASQTYGKPGKGIRVLFGEQGDVVGLEVLGWSRRTPDPNEVTVSIVEDAVVLDANSRLSQLLADEHGLSIADDANGTPTEDGIRLIPLSEAVAMSGVDRSWLSRQASAGVLEAKKIGGRWWTRPDWLKRYMRGREIGTAGLRRVAAVRTGRRAKTKAAKT